MLQTIWLLPAMCPHRLTLVLALVAALPLCVRAADELKAAGAAYPGKYRDELYRYAQESNWTDTSRQPRLTRPVLVESVEAARAYLLSHQKPEGNFVYEYDAVTNQTSEEDNAVRQAGALWALSVLHRERPTRETRHAAIRGLDFFFKCSRPLDSGKIGPVYPGEYEIKTGSVALLCLAIVDFCRGEQVYLTDAGQGFYESWLTQYLDYLQDMELGNGSWGARYLVELREKDPEPSPYSDGECLLAYCRAARYLGRKDLIPKIEAMAVQLAEKYTVEAWNGDIDSEATKSFFQWGCMAFAEYTDAGWKNADAIGDAALALAWWSIHQYRVQTQRGNCAFAVEGLLAAWQIARQRRDEQTMRTLQNACADMLRDQIACQIGGPLAESNPFLKGAKRLSPQSHGGVMNSKNSGKIRIDVVQHQTHALLLALKLLFPEPPQPAAPKPK